MLANLLIGLREGLEAALIVSIVLATLARQGRRDLMPRVWIGVGVAIAGTLVLGAILTWGPYGLSFAGQEIVGGSLSIVAVGFITWMLLWMGKASASMKADVERRVDRAVATGGIALVVMAAVAVVREGVETTLFIWATVDAAGGIGPATLSALAGILIACGIGWLIYRGIVRVNLRAFFLWTAVALVIVAAGVLAYGIGDLQEANVLPPQHPAYSLAWLLPNDSVAGTVLYGLVNYTSEPTWLQVAGWWAYVLVMLPVLLRTAGIRLARTAPASKENP